MTVFEGGALATRCPAMSGARPVVRHSCWAATSGELYDTIEGNTSVYPGLWSVGLAKVEVCLLALTPLLLQLLLLFISFRIHSILSPIWCNIKSPMCAHTFIFQLWLQSLWLEHSDCVTHVCKCSHHQILMMMTRWQMFCSGAPLARQGLWSVGAKPGPLLTSQDGIVIITGPIATIITSHHLQTNFAFPSINQQLYIFS